MKSKILPLKYTSDDKNSVISATVEISDFTEAEYRYIIKDRFSRLKEKYKSQMTDDYPIVINIEVNLVSAVDPIFKESCIKFQNELSAWCIELHGLIACKKEWLDLKNDIIDLNQKLDKIHKELMDGIKITQDTLSKRFGEKFWK